MIRTFLIHTHQNSNCDKKFIVNNKPVIKVFKKFPSLQVVKLEETATKVIKRLRATSLTPADDEFQGILLVEQMRTELSGLELAKMAQEKTGRPVVVILDRGTFFLFLLSL